MPTATAETRVFDYVNRPYERVRAALTKDALAIFQSATRAAASRAQSVASQLRVDLGGIAIETDIHIAVTSIDESDSPPLTRLHLEWRAATHPALFPLMKASLALYPLTTTETQLDFTGIYEPPLGLVGKVVNAAVGHRIAEASVHRFVSDVATYLRAQLQNSNLA